MGWFNKSKLGEILKNNKHSSTSGPSLNITTYRTANYSIYWTNYTIVLIVVISRFIDVLTKYKGFKLKNASGAFFNLKPVYYVRTALEITFKGFPIIVIGEEWFWPIILNLTKVRYCRYLISAVLIVRYNLWRIYCKTLLN